MTMPNTTPKSQLVRSVGFWGLSALVLNGLIGAGIFGLPAAVATQVGGWAPLVVLLVGVSMSPVVLVFARLSRLFDGTGGPIEYVESAFGKSAAFQIGWMQVLSTTASAAANINLLADYAMREWPSAAADPLVHAAVVLAALLLVLLINLNRTNGVARALSVIAIVKLAPLFVLVILALPAIVGDAGNAHPTTQWSFTQAALLSAYAFTGFEGALTLAGEARDPKKDFPRALVMVFAVVGLLYVLLVWGYVATAYVPGMPETAPLTAMAVTVIGGSGALLIILVATTSIFGNVTNNLLFLSRRLLALEALGGLPPWFGRVHRGNAVPRNAVIFVMALLVALSLSGGFAALAVLSVAARLIVYLGCILALPIIEKRRIGAPGGVASAVTVAAAATCIALIAGSEAGSWLALGVAAGLGAVIFYATRARMVAHT